MYMKNSLHQFHFSKAGLILVCLCILSSAAVAADDKIIYLKCQAQKSAWILKLGNNQWFHYDVETKSWGTNLCKGSLSGDYSSECRMDDSEISKIVRYSHGVAAGDTRVFKINRYTGTLSIETIARTGELYTSILTCQVVPEPQAGPLRF